MKGSRRRESKVRNKEADLYIDEVAEFSKILQNSFIFYFYHK